MSKTIAHTSTDPVVAVAQEPERHLVRAHSPQRQVVLVGLRGRTGSPGEGDTQGDAVPVVVRASAETVVSVTQEPERHLVRAHSPQSQVVLAGVRGRPGPAGETAGDTLERDVGAVISALMMVYEQDGLVYPADRMQVSVYQLLGVTLTGASPPGKVRVRRQGVVDDSSWNWLLGPVWLGSAGGLTQTPPTEGFNVVVGYAVGPHRLIVGPHPPIKLL